MRCGWAHHFGNFLRQEARVDLIFHLYGKGVFVADLQQVFEQRQQVLSAITNVTSIIPVSVLLDWPEAECLLLYRFRKADD